MELVPQTTPHSYRAIYPLHVPLVMPVGPHTSIETVHTKERHIEILLTRHKAGEQVEGVTVL